MYALTIKYNPLDINDFYLPNLYSDLLDYLTQFFLYKELQFENDSKGKLHVHGTVILKPKVKHHAYQLPLFHIYTKKLTDRKKWSSYINKKPEQIILPDSEYIKTQETNKLKISQSLIKPWYVKSQTFEANLQCERTEPTEQKEDSISPATPV